MSLAAEIQHQLLPSAACCEAAQFTIAGTPVPADDTYDYTLDRDTLHLLITDGADHDVASALTATLLVGALCGARRAGHDLAEQAWQAYQTLLDHGGEVHWRPAATACGPANGRRRAGRRRTSRIAAVRRCGETGRAGARPALRRPVVPVPGATAGPASR
jgi:hypothetical protein